MHIEPSAAIGSGQAIVIGAGLGGMAAALRLRAQGWSVRLLERNTTLGGRARTFTRGDYRHDGGPTVITAPALLEELFALFGEKLSDHVTLVQPEPWYRFRFADGETFDYGPTPERTEAEITRLSPSDLDGYRRLKTASEALCAKAYDELAAQPFHRFGSMLAQLPAMAKLRSDRSVWSFVSHHVKDERLRQAFSVQPLLVGGHPFETTSIYGMIHHLEQREGIWFALGGTGAIVDALQRLMRRVGIEIETGTSAAMIETKGDAVSAVLCEDGRRHRADIVVYNGDPMRLYGRMLPDRKLPVLTRFRMRRARLSMGLFVLYFGTRRRYDDVAHHTILFGARFRQLLDDIFHGGRTGDDVALYLHRPSATDPAFAPAGRDSFYVLCPVPNLTAPIDWTLEGPRLQRLIVERLQATVLPGLSEMIDEPFFMTPVDFEHDYLSEGGAGFSLAPHFTQSAWFRFHNRGEGVDGLYLVGAGTHPGAGVPGVLSSARVLDRLVKQHAA